MFKNLFWNFLDGVGCFINLKLQFLGVSEFLCVKREETFPRRRPLAVPL
jgi:hypothetical protein